MESILWCLSAPINLYLDKSAKQFRLTSNNITDTLEYLFLGDVQLKALNSIKGGQIRVESHLH